MSTAIAPPTSVVRTVADLREVLAGVPSWALVHTPEPVCQTVPADLSVEYTAGELLLEPVSQPRPHPCRCCATTHPSPWEQLTKTRRAPGSPHPPVGRMRQQTAADLLTVLADLPGTADVLLLDTSQEWTLAPVTTTYHAGVLWLEPTDDVYCTCCLALED